MFDQGISRRKLLRTTALGAASAALTPALSVGRALAESKPEPSSAKAFEFDEATISDLQRRMTAGELSAHSLVQAYLARIDEIDDNCSRTACQKQKATGLNAVIELNLGALAIADELDRERKSKGPRGPMHGIPVLIKDNIDTADAMQTTAGSLALVGSKPAQDSGVAKKLGGGGAVIFGKTHS